MRLEYFLPLPILPSLWFFARLARTHWRQDRFLRGLHANHRAIWESLGSPRGWMWSPPGRTANPFSMFSFHYDWLRHDPGWLAEAPELRENFQQLREGSREWIFRAMPIMVVSWILFFVIIKLTER